MKTENREMFQSRNYKLVLTDEEAERLAYAAGQHGITTIELLENFISDMTGSDRSGGSDERDCADNWYTRRYYPDDCFKNLTTFVCNIYGASGIHDIVDIITSLQTIQDDIDYCAEKLQDPGDEWKNFTTSKCIDGVMSSIPAYNSQDEYIADLKAEQDSYREDYEAVSEILENYRKEFDGYMDGKSYNWDDELTAFLSWHTASVPNKED